MIVIMKILIKVPFHGDFDHKRTKAGLKSGMSEKQHTYRRIISAADIYANGYIKPGSALDFYQRVVEEHMHGYGLDIFTMVDSGCAWTLVSADILFYPVTTGRRHLDFKTWWILNSPYFRREMIALSADGEPAFKCSTHSVLMDLSRRSIMRPSDLPFKIMEPSNNSPAIPDAQARYKFDCGVESSGVYAVTNSFVDILGHTNNVRYAEAAFDALGSDIIENGIKRMQMSFLCELTLSQEYEVFKSSGDGFSIVSIIRRCDGKTAFSSKFIF